MCVRERKRDAVSNSANPMIVDRWWVGCFCFCCVAACAAAHPTKERVSQRFGVHLLWKSRRSRFQATVVFLYLPLCRGIVLIPDSMTKRPHSPFERVFGSNGCSHVDFFLRRATVPYSTVWYCTMCTIANVLWEHECRISSMISWHTNTRNSWKTDTIHSITHPCQVKVLLFPIP